MKKLLLHICCGPCLLAVHDRVGQEYDWSGIFFNPNIHPLQEYRKRQRGLQIVQERLKADIRYETEPASPKEFLSAIMQAPCRCKACFYLRLRRTADIAVELDVPAFATTLTCSVYQDHDAIKSVGEQVAQETEREFVYLDCRDMQKTALAEAKRISLYRQQYCGCIFSEYERYSAAATKSP